MKVHLFLTTELKRLHFSPPCLTIVTQPKRKLALKRGFSPPWVTNIDLSRGV